MERFIGNIDAKIDAKGRVFVPAAFRKILQSAGDMRLILRKDVFQDCLILYPAEVWFAELDKLRDKLNLWDEEQQRLYDQFQLEMEIVEIDSMGRILIPKRYLQLAGITSEMRFVGVDNTIKLWERSQLEKYAMSKEEFRDSVRKFLN